MFGFLRKKNAREHLKLMYQNEMSVEYIHAFDAELANSVRSQTKAVKNIWDVGLPLPDDFVDLMLNAHRALRRVYDQTPAKYLRSFDEEYQPILGRKEYFERFE